LPNNGFPRFIIGGKNILRRNAVSFRLLMEYATLIAA
jgi:hypothetical protein